MPMLCFCYSDRGKALAILLSHQIGAEVINRLNEGPEYVICVKVLLLVALNKEFVAKLSY
jgi:hypothetical protein